MKESFSFIVQARYGSTRLPGKITLPFSGQKTILDIQLDNILGHFPGSPVILATTNNKADDLIVEKYSSNKQLHVFRGDEDDVLNRFIQAANAFDAKNIVRVCSDNPFLSMPHINKLVEGYFKASPDYISFGFKEGTPAIRSHTGLFAEMVSLKALEKVKAFTHEKLYMEHVTNYIYTNPTQFKVEFVPVPAILDDYLDKLRLTIDTMQDFTHLQKLYLAVSVKYGAEYTIEQLLLEVEKDKELLKSMTEQIKQYAK
jgi:spore coat polysaccharide biosynthesis protein SpsF